MGLGSDQVLNDANKIIQYFYFMNWKEHIISDKNILLGKPAIKGTRISVELILELLAQGWTNKMILESYPNITEDSIKAVFLYLKECMQEELYFPNRKSA